MSLLAKTIKGKRYYYSFLSYFTIGKSKSFSKYIGSKAPRPGELALLEERFRNELMKRLCGRQCTNNMLGKDDVIKTLLFSDMFRKRYEKLPELVKRKYDIDTTVSFTLTTLTTEEVEVELNDVRAALSKNTGLTRKERISRNMLNAVELIKQQNKPLNKRMLFHLHSMIMATFRDKTPGKQRMRQVYLYRKAELGQQAGVMVKYQPPKYTEIDKMLDAFFKWYKESSLNPVEKAAIAHFRLYRIHPFLDGNKRVCRLVFNKTLLQDGFPLINISLNKEKYFDALVAAVESDDPKPFADFVLKEYYSQTKAFLTARWVR